MTIFDLVVCFFAALGLAHAPVALRQSEGLEARLRSKVSLLLVAVKGSLRRPGHGDWTQLALDHVDDRRRSLLAIFVAWLEAVDHLELGVRNLEETRCFLVARDFWKARTSVSKQLEAEGQQLKLTPSPYDAALVHILD